MAQRTRISPLKRLVYKVLSKKPLVYIKKSKRFRKFIANIINPFLHMYIKGKGIPPQLRLLRNVPWRTLIILDACRYDVFREVFTKKFSRAFSETDYSLTPAESPATWTIPWLAEVFGHGDWSDTMYITANPTYTRLGNFNPFEVFGEVVEVWRDYWSEELGTVHPSYVEQAFHEVFNKLNQGIKRYVVHFLQPHYPYLTRTFGYRPEESQVFWRNVRDGLIPLDQVIAAYTENLEIALCYAVKIAMSAPKPVVLTSDHGELFGEFFLFTHNKWIRAPPLVIVPFLLIK